MMKKITTFLKFKALIFLSNVAKPISQRRSKRFLRSAAKCTPDGYNLNIDESLAYHKVIQRWNLLRRKQISIKNNILNKVKDGPIVSIIINISHYDINSLNCTIESALNQSYKNIEILFSCSEGCKINARELTEKYSGVDNRIKINDKVQITAINESILKSSGEFISIINHGDILDADAILEVISLIHEDKRIRIIYTDEDKISNDGIRSDPHFKPDWNRELLYNTNYIGGMVAYHAKTLKSINTININNDASVSYDIFLKMLEVIDDASISHLPKVLYSRYEPNDNSNYSDEVTFRYMRNCIDALKGHLLRTHGRNIDVSNGLLPNSWKIEWPIRPNELVSIIIPTRNRLDLIEAAVVSIIEKTSYANYEIIIVDNNSNDPDFLKWASEIHNYDSRIKVIRDERPFNYSAINNSAVNVSSGDIVALVNNDIEVIDGNWLSEMVSLVQRDEVGCVGAKLLYPDGRIQHAGVIIGLGGVAGHGHVLCDNNDPGYFGRLLVRQEYTAVTAACLLVRKKVYAAVGGLNESNLSVAFNDVDFCMKVNNLGYKNIWTPYAILTHHESVSRGQENTPEKKNRFESEVSYMMNQWNISEYKDPAYNINMTLRWKSFTYTDPIWNCISNNKNNS